MASLTNVAELAQEDSFAVVSTVRADGTVRFRVFSLDHAPALVVGGREHAMEDEGHGYASQLVKAALDDTRHAGFKIQPGCSFVVDYVRRHPEYRDAL